jgi:hypothetical protein
MEPHTLATFTAKLIEEHGAPQVLDVEHSILVHKPTLTGSSSPASYYIGPPSGMSAEAFIEWFESIPGAREFRLTLVPILGLDTYHQPLISSDDFAKKYFHDSHMRIVRVVGKSNQAIEAMAAFVEALKRPFDAELFPHHQDFSVSGYRPPEPGRATEVKLLFKPADHNLLMKVERLVSVHLDECNLGREIGASRHATRDQPPELILTSTSNTPAGVAFLEALVSSLARATTEEIVEATEVAKRTHSQSAGAHNPQSRFAQPKVATRVLPPEELKKKVIASLADVLRASHFANGVDVDVVQAGTTIEVKFPRTASSLWLATTFSEGKHISELTNSCIGVRTDPVFREGWEAVYNYDSRAGKLHIRAVESGSAPPDGWKEVPRQPQHSPAPVRPPALW